MNKLKEISVDLLCQFGKFGVGKSILLGMYDFAVPEQLRDSQWEEIKNRAQDGNFKKSMDRGT